MKKSPFTFLRRMHPATLSREERIMDIIFAFTGIAVGLIFVGMAAALILVDMFYAGLSFACLGLFSLGLGWHLGEGVRRDGQWRDAGQPWEEPR